MGVLAVKNVLQVAAQGAVKRDDLPERVIGDVARVREAADQAERLPR